MRAHPHRRRSSKYSEYSSSRRRGSLWWYVDLAKPTKIHRVVVYNRQDCCSDRLSNFHVDVRDSSNRTLVRKNFSGVAGAQTTFDFGGVSGERVVVELNGSNVLSLAEVQVMGI